MFKYLISLPSHTHLPLFSSNPWEHFTILKLMTRFDNDEHSQTPSGWRIKVAEVSAVKKMICYCSTRAIKLNPSFSLTKNCCCYCIGCSDNSWDRIPVLIYSRYTNFHRISSHFTYYMASANIIWLINSLTKAIFTGCDVMAIGIFSS